MARQDDYDTEEFDFEAYGDQEQAGDEEYIAGEYDDGRFGDQPALIYSLHPEDETGFDGDSTGPGPGCITFTTLLVCAVMAVLLLRMAAGIPIPISPAIANAVADQAYLAAAPPAADPSAGPLLAPNSEAAAAPCQISSLFPEKVLRWCSPISFYAARHNLNPDLVAALVWLESGGDELAYSSSGAVGLMQVMPSDGLAASFTCVNGPCFSDRPTTAELQNPEFNVAYGTRMLAGLLNKNGDLREALRSYGPMNVGYYYSDKVLGLFEKYRATP